MDDDTKKYHVKRACELAQQLERTANYMNDLITCGHYDEVHDLADYISAVNMHLREQLAILQRE